MPWFVNLSIVYFCVVSLVAVVMTVIDKSAAKRGAWRIPEATLMLVGLFGGAFAMYITMQTVRHKTKHKKFMIGLPFEIALHAAIVFFVLFGKLNLI